MPIKVQCACGAAFAAKDELAGRTVKCPKCQQPLAIPAAGPAAPAAAAPRQPAAPRPMSAPLPSQAAAPAQQSTGDLFDEMGLQAPQAGKVPCPGCATPMPVEAIICIKCGFNKRIGRRMETVKGTGTGQDIPGGHGVTVDELLNKAARTIEEDKEEERKKTAEGMPWWIYLIGIVGVVGFMIAMMFIPQGMGLVIGGMVLVTASALLQFYAWLRALIAAFIESPLIGIAIFFADMFIAAGLAALVLFVDVPIPGIIIRWGYIPPCWAIFIFTHWDSLGYWWNLFIVGVLIRWVGLGMLLAAIFLFADQEDARLPPAPPPAATVSAGQSTNRPTVKKSENYGASKLRAASSVSARDAFDAKVAPSPTNSLPVLAPLFQGVELYSHSNSYS